MPAYENFSVPEPVKNWRLGFWSLIATQFQGAFNENGLKQLVIFLILAMNLAKEERDRLVPIVGALFSAPFILFSMTGGYLADRFSKRSVTIWTKVFEILVMLLAFFALATENLPLEMAAVFLASTQAAFFGPSKYGLLPEILPQKRLSWGNGIIELGTFVAVIAGSVAAGFMAEGFRGRQGYSGAILVGCAILGLLCSQGITRVPPADPLKKFRANVFGDLWSQGKLIRSDRVLFLAVLGNTYFWFLGALLQFDIIVYGQDVLKLSSSSNSILQAAIAIGIGVGSLAAGFLSAGKIEYGLIPLGSLGMTVLGIFLARHGSAELIVSADQATHRGTRLDRLGDPMLSEGTVFFGALTADGDSSLFNIFEGKINKIVPIEKPETNVAFPATANRHTIETTSVSINQRGQIAYLGSP